MPRLRENFITGEWVVVAPERSSRPKDFISSTPTEKADKKDCPFCVENNVAYKTSIKKFETDKVYVIPNLYPAFVGEDEVTHIGGDYYPSHKSLGGHDVIILKNHDKELEDLDRATLEEYYHTYQRRIKYFNSNPVVEYSMVIHNYGSESGASIVHPHSQLMASSVIPPRILAEVEGSKKYYLKNGVCVFCDLVKKEQQAGVRIIGENKYFLAFTFWAPRFPFETWIVPKNHQIQFENIGRTERLAMADIFKSVLGKLDKSLNKPGYNYYIHSGPPRMENQKDLEKFYHWHIEIAPRTSTFGGYELGSGMVISVVSPEKAAKFLNSENDNKDQK